MTHPGTGWLEFSAIDRKGKSTYVMLLNLLPGAKHPVCLQESTPIFSMNTDVIRVLIENI